MAEKKEQLKLTKSRWKVLKERIGKNIIDCFQKINLRKENVERKNDMSEQQQIEEILEEANAYNLKWEVMDTATRLLKENKSDLSELSAYVIAYNKWIK